MPGLQFAFFVARPAHSDPKLARRLLTIVEPPKVASPPGALKSDRVELDPLPAIKDFD